MRQIGLPFTILATDADESLPEGTPPAGMVEALALRKAQAAAAEHAQALIIGADTVVAIAGQVLGKPHGREDAARMLRLLSGKTHEVYTGVALICPFGREVFHERTRVHFFPLSERMIDWYLDTGEPFDKAGAYGIQQKGALLVEGIEGDYFNVMGFPLARAARKIGRMLEGPGDGQA